MHRIALAIALSAGVIAAPLAAAPLCHDLKGLYTPCPRAVAGHVERARAAATSVVSEHAERPARLERPPVIARVKLCRDLKGLFTPCRR